MKCPTCGVWVRVISTRSRQNNTTYRRYECGNLHRFTTFERIEPTNQRGARPKKEAQ